jgi:integrase
MPRNSKAIDITYPSNRAKLPIEPEPHWHRIAEGQHLGYRKLAANEGTWIARYRVSGIKKRYYKALGAADGPRKPANGTHVLSFQQALEAALRWFVTVAKADAAGVQIGPYTVADAAHDWIAAWTGSEAGKRNAEGNLKNHILPALGHIEVATLKRQKAQEWLQELGAKPPVRRQKHLASTEKLPPSRRTKVKFDPNDPETIRKRRDTANRIFNDLSALLTLAYENGKVHSKAAWETVQKFENVGRAKNEYLSIEEFKAFATTCPLDFADLVRGAVITGCRYMELGRMLVSAYDPTNKSVSMVQRKTGKVKHVYLTDEESVLIEGLAAGKRHTDLLFTQLALDAEGKRIAKPWVKSAQQPRMRAALRAAGINRHVRFHDLRHTFATWQVAAGTSIQMVANQLGHTSTRIAEEHYAHYSPSHIASTIRANKPKLL